ncbi:IS4 family transposase [bacterium]|nr:IS4 family transposase [bacterium]MBU1959002.1 IS4 family transposase [bacterium]
MSYNPKLVKLQKNINLNELKNSDLDFIEKYISKDNIVELNSNSKNPIYTPKQTLSMFVSQAINQDGSCQNVVNKLALEKDKDICISTSAYCQARGRLSVIAISNITKEIARVDEDRINSKWKFRGRNVYLVDGTTIAMADTLANQKAYPQPNFQKEGLGFPICRLVGIISLTTGSIIDVNIGTYGGKGTGERMLFQEMLHNFKEGDIILADALYSTYSLLSFAIEKGIDIIFVQNGSRAKKTDFTTGEILGKNDHVITLKRPKDVPEWMSKEEGKNRPKELKIREIKTGDKILITTFLCKKTTSAKIIKKLYKERWHIEVDFRNIKITLNFTPQW